MRIETKRLLITDFCIADNIASARVMEKSNK